MSATALPQQFRVPSSKASYQFETAYDEMFEAPGVPREHYQALHIRPISRQNVRPQIDGV